MARARWGQLLGLFLLFSSLPLQAGVQNVCYLIDTDFGPDDRKRSRGCLMMT